MNKKLVKESKKSIKKNVKRIDIKTFILSNITKVKNTFNKIVKKAKHLSKKRKKSTKIDQKLAQNRRNHVILGLGQLFVVVSIIYSTFIVRTFVDTDISLIALAPQVIFALCILLKAFSKLYK